MYTFHLILAKTANFLLVNVFIPSAIFILLGPLALLLIYAIENDIALSIDNLNTEQVKTISLTELKQPIIQQPNTQAVNFLVKQTDYRAVVLDTYFARYNSPLNGYGQVFVDACNKYNAPYDCTTLPAIAYVETRLCTLALSAQQKNCWGFGGSPPNRYTFKSYNDAIDLITDRLVNKYGKSYMLNPVSMQHIYCGPGCNNWGKSVQQQRDAINRLAQEMGFAKLY